MGEDIEVGEDMEEEEVDMVEVEVDMMEVEEEVEGEVVMLELIRCNQTTKYLSKDYQQMPLRKILLNFSDPLVSSKMTVKLESNAYSSILTVTLVFLKERQLSRMMTPALRRVPFSGSMGKTLMGSQLKSAWQ